MMDFILYIKLGKFKLLHLFRRGLFYSIGKHKMFSYTAGVGLEGVQAPIPRGNSEPKASAIGAEPLWTRKVMTKT